MARVVILGAGISGHTAALHLRRKLGREHAVTVVSPNEMWNWIPSNIWVGVGEMEKADVVFPLAPVYRRKGIDFRQARAMALRPEGTVDDATPTVEIEYTDAVRLGRERASPVRLSRQRHGPRLNFGATPGLGPDGGQTVSVCTADHATAAARAAPRQHRAMLAGEPQTLVVGMGHGTCTCEGAAFEYVFNVDHELREAGVRDMADLVLPDQREGPGGLRGRRDGVSESGMRPPASSGPSRCSGSAASVPSPVPTCSRSRRGRSQYSLLDDSVETSRFDFAMLLPPFTGVGLKVFDRQGADITDRLFAPNKFMRVDADYAAKPYEDWGPEDWPRDLPEPVVRERVRRGHRLRAAPPDLATSQDPWRCGDLTVPTPHRDAVGSDGQDRRRDHRRPRHRSGATPLPTGRRWRAWGPPASHPRAQGCGRAPRPR